MRKTPDWSSYPAPHLRFIRGKWVVEVSIPRGIRHLFGKAGKGTTNNRRKSTGTTDKALAEGMKYELARQIYQELDDRVREAHLAKQEAYEEIASQRVMSLAEVFNYKGGRYKKVQLDPNTSFDVLLELKMTLDGYVRLVHESSVYPAEDFQDNNEPPRAFSKAQMLAVRGYQHPLVQEWLQDLLTDAAILQGRDQPVFKEQDALPVGGFFVSTDSGKPIAKPLRSPRQRKHTPLTERKVSNVKTDFFEVVDRDYDRNDTKRKIRLAVNEFERLMDDPPIAEIVEHHAYRFADALIQERAGQDKTIGRTTLMNHKWGVSMFLQWCTEQEYIVGNPFKGVSLGKRGQKSQRWLPYTREELHRIFQQDMAEQERLLLSILVTTGMRLDEAARLTWDQFNDTEYDGIRYFFLFDTEDVQVDVKNEGSARIVPLHRSLWLPPKGVGRLFNYKLDGDGKAVTSAGRAINKPILKKAVPHPKKSAHSLRGTLKILARDAGVSDVVNDYYTGHSIGDTSNKSYKGMSVERRFEEINKINHPWLK